MNEPDKKLSEGKTKIIWQDPDDPRMIVSEAKDDITAGDGAKHDTIIGKAELATRTTANVFHLLWKKGIPVAFVERISEARFRGQRCRMVELEVVVRGKAYGSYLHRYPKTPTGSDFKPPLLEFFAKTNDRRWDGQAIPMDDPLLDLSGDPVKFFLPHWTEEQKREAKETDRKDFLVGQQPFLEIPRQKFLDQIGVNENILANIIDLAIRTFLILKDAWQELDRQLVDFKIEFGIDCSSGEVRVADVIDNDSWRVLQEKEHLDKEAYRQGAPLDTVTDKYRLVADLTDKFA